MNDQGTKPDVLEHLLVGDQIEVDSHCCHHLTSNHKWAATDGKAEDEGTDDDEREHEILLKLTISQQQAAGDGLDNRIQSPTAPIVGDDDQDVVVSNDLGNIRRTSAVAGRSSAVGSNIGFPRSNGDRDESADQMCQTNRISMTTREHQWIERIQLLQTAVADSLNEDYYYQMNFLKKYGFPPPAVKVVPSDSRPYETPLASDRRILGRLNALSSSHPRQLIELDDPDKRTYVKADATKAALLKVEQIYGWLLEAQTERQKRTFSQYQQQQQYKSEQKVLDPARPLSLFLSPDLPQMLTVARGRRLIIHLLPIVSDLVSYLFHILSAIVHKGQALDRDTYKALLIPLVHLPINQLLVLVNILVQSKTSALSPLLKTRFGLTLLLRLSLLCSCHLWPLLAAVAAAAATQASDPSGFSAAASPPALLNVHPQLVLLRQFLQKICQVLQPVETRHLQIPFEPVHQLAVTFQRVLVASATACHQSATGVIPSGVLAKLEYLEARSLDEQQSFLLSGLSFSVGPWIPSTQVGSYRAPWPAVPTERTR